MTPHRRSGATSASLLVCPPLAALLVFLVAGTWPGSAAANPRVDKASCSLKGFRLFGRVQVVESFPDLKVQVVTAFPDLKVQTVSVFPDRCGKWQFVDSFPDFKIKMVTSFPDLKIQFETAFPGVP